MAKFVSGQSGNPGGRPKGFAAAIKAKCGDDYERLVDGLYILAFGSPTEIAEYFQHAGLEVDAKIRLAALIELRDSGPGKPKSVVELETPPDVPLFAITAAIAVQPVRLSAAPAPQLLPTESETT
jgi:hypothetical protein